MIKFIEEMKKIDTPLIVTLFFCDYLGINIDEERMDDMIYNTRIILTILNSLQNFDLPLTELTEKARLINPNTDIIWKEEELNLSYNFFLKIINNECIEHIMEYKIEYQNPKEPYNINRFMLFILCLNNNIKMNRYTNERDLYISLILKQENISLFNDIVGSPYCNKDSKIISAERYNYNIYHSKDPSIEFLFFLKDKVYDERMKYVFSINRDAYNIDQYFDIIVDNDSNNSNGKLYSDHIIDNFSLGYSHYCDNVICPISHKPFDDQDIIICFGCQTTYLRAYLIEELTDLFNYYGYFFNPNGGNFPQYCIVTLLKLCKKNIDTDRRYGLLLKSINKIKRDFAGVLRKISNISGDKEIIKEVLKDIFELGLYMRGWNGKDEHPIENTPYVEYLNIDIRVNEKLFYILGKTESEYASILDLPLVKYKDRYFTIKDKNRGLTIMKRLKIVLKNSSIHACVRLTSNLLCSSANFYLERITGNSFFDINNLNIIS